MTRKESSRFSGFNIAATIAGLLALALLALSVLGTKRGPHGRSRVLSEISALSVALESYKFEYGDYPRAAGPIGTNQTANANILYQALVVSNAAFNPRGKVFFEPYKAICASTNYTSPTNYFVDPSGRPYQYRYPGAPDKSGTNFFDLFSYNKSRKTADISNNWEFWANNW